MRVKSVILLPVLVVVVGAYIWYLAAHPAPVFPMRGDHPLRDIPREKVKNFILDVPLYRDYNPDVFPEIEGDMPGQMKVQESTDAKMLVRHLVFEQLPDQELRETFPHNQRSDQEILQALLSQILDMTIYEKVEFHPDAMGFVDPKQVRVTIETTDGRKVEVDFGALSADKSMIYFKLADSPYAYLTPVGRLNELRMPEEKFLDHNLWSVPPSQIQEFRIQTWDQGEKDLDMEAYRIDSIDTRGRPTRGWKLSDRPLDQVDQEQMRKLRLSLMTLRATNRQWNLEYHELPPRFQFPVPWPNPIMGTKPVDRVLLTITHAPGADDEEGKVEQYEMIQVEVPPELYALYTQIPIQQQDPAKRRFWVARHYATLSERMHDQQEAEKNGDQTPFDYEWISFTRSAVDDLVALAHRINAGTEPAQPAAGQAGADFMQHGQ
ncbi:MAG: DUF4340 domain-containing protein [Planctomycetota bacterium]